MELSTYIKSMNKDELKSFADRCGTSPQYLKKVYLGYRQPSGDLAINIERESNRTIRVEQLRPEADWQFIRATSA